MSKVDKVPDELLAEYDFSSMNGGVRGKYHQRYRAGVNLALLDPDVAKAFPTDVEVNTALRKVMRTSRPSKLPNKRMQLARSRKSKTTRPRS
jgi:hypothetical protein